MGVSHEFSERPCFNIFAFANAEERVINSVGLIEYLMWGTDKDLVGFLQSKVEEDHWKSTRTELERPVSIEEFKLLRRLDRLYEVMPRVCEIVGESVYCITYITDSAPKIEEVDNPFSQDGIPDYLSIYMTEDGLDIPSLINDDFFEATKTLWRSKKYISALKLILSMVDTLAFIEYGDADGCFTNWLQEFCDLKELGVTSKELWELRNSLLHMTNLESRKVQRGIVQSLVPVIADPSIEFPKEVDGFKCLDLFQLITVTLPNGISNWIRTYNEHREKFVYFVERYDRVTSDSRLRYTYLPISNQ